MVTMKKRWEAKQRLAKIDAIWAARLGGDVSPRTLPERIGRWLNEVRHWVLGAWRRLRAADERIQTGFARTEVWNLYHDHARWCLPRLKHLRDNFTGMPMKSGPFTEDEGWASYTAEEWREILHKMCRAFYLVIASDDDIEVEFDPLTRELIEEGLALFSKHYLSLWD